MPLTNLIRYPFEKGSQQKIFISCFLVLFILSAIGCQTTQEEKKYATLGSIERNNSQLNQIIPEDAQIEILGEGFNWSEGPVWVPEHNRLLFSDIPENKIFQWQPGDSVSLYLKPAGYTGPGTRGGELGSNGLTLDAQGRLVLCQHGDRRIARMETPIDAPKSNFTTLAGTYQGKKFNSPNDLVYHSNGDLYFSDPPYGLEENVDDPAKELDFQGVFRLNTEGEVQLLTQELTRPNGIAFSPDEQKLYVANSDPEKAIWMEYEVTGDGGITNGQVFHDATDQVGKAKGLPDGMTVDNNGIIYATGPGGVWIFQPDGTHLGTIKTGQATSNCTIGQNGRYLFMTADMYLVRVELK